MHRRRRPRSDDSGALAAGDIAGDHWSESFSKAIWRYPLLPTPATPQKLVGDLSGPSTLLVDATSIVFDQSGDESGTIAKVPIGGASVPTPIASMNTFERGIAGDAKSIFVALDDSIVEIDRATGTKKVLARGAFFARGIAVDEKAVYFTNRNGVMKVVR